MIRRKVKDFWRRLLKRDQQFFVEISGLSKGDEVFKTSIESEFQNALRKFSRFMGDIEGISLHVKSRLKAGRKTHYELKGILKAKGFEVHSKAEGLDMYDALRRLIREFERLVQKESGKRKKKR
ncbi:MAG: hypothetical protein V1834_01135 [Candidatus Micrarchaeota archaeon]